MFAWGFSHHGNFSVALEEIRTSFLYSSKRVSFRFHSRWKHPKYTWSRNDVGCSKIDQFHHFLPHGTTCCFFPAILMSSTHTDKNNPCFRWANYSSRNTTSSNCLSHKRPASVCPYRFRSRGTTESSDVWQGFLGHLCRGRRSHISGHSDFPPFNNFGVLHSYLGVSRYCVGGLSCTIR